MLFQIDVRCSGGGAIGECDFLSGVAGFGGLENIIKGGMYPVLREK